MKVIMDGLVLFLNNNQVGNYSRSIVDNLIKYSSLDLDIIKDYEIDSNKYNKNSVELTLNRRDNDYSNLSFFLRNTDYKLYHCLNNGFSIPKNFDFNYVMSITNLLPLYDEKSCSSAYISNYFSKLPYGVLNSSYIICPSVTSKDFFLNSFSLSEEKVFVNYGVVSNFYTKTDDFLSSIYVKSKFDIENEYIVFSGDFHRRKKLENCLVLISKLKRFVPNLKFLIVSFDFSDLSYLNSLKELSRKLNLNDDILYLCNLSIMDKVNIYNRALFFIDLSFYEDVNIDIIEAFACNTP
ncbi:MAG: glycosyltransferase, partial [Romboutsia sp.]|uniref:glycosyltransferase n=1 Tax=Romboutsia sp. TaxID=1965302 RepID=UPI003F315116